MKKALLIQIAVCLVALGSVEAGFRAVITRRSNSERTLSTAMHGPDGALVFLGDSRTVASINHEALQARLQQRGVDLPSVGLAIGGMDLPGGVLALTRYLDAGKRPAAVVLGYDGSFLTAWRQPPDPGELIGNEASMIHWSGIDDFRVFYPQFPLHNLDAGIRFLITRVSTFATFRSFLWFKVQALQDRLAGTSAPAGGSNQFGQIDVMRRFAEELQGRLARYYGSTRQGTAWALDPWFLRLADRLQREDIPLILLEVPMSGAFRRIEQQNPDAIAFHAWFEGQRAVRGWTHIDARAPAIFDGRPDDALYGDGLHLDPGPAREFSMLLADTLAALRSPTPAATARRAEPAHPPRFAARSLRLGEAAAPDNRRADPGPLSLHHPAPAASTPRTP